MSGEQKQRLGTYMNVRTGTTLNTTKMAAKVCTWLSVGPGDEGNEIKTGQDGVDEGPFADESVYSLGTTNSRKGLADRWLAISSAS
jgi:hypothetical protein